MQLLIFTVKFLFLACPIGNAWPAAGRRQLVAGRQPRPRWPDRPGTALFERLLGQANDLGQLAEEIDPASGELLGNFPKAFSHVELISAATNLQRGRRTYRAASG